MYGPPTAREEATVATRGDAVTLEEPCDRNTGVQESTSSGTRVLRFVFHFVLGLNRKPLQGFCSVRLEDVRVNQGLGTSSRQFGSGLDLGLESSGSFPKIRGTLFWGPYKKDPTI